MRPVELDGTHIRVQGLTKVYQTQTGNMTVLDIADVTVMRGEFFCIVGPSGCGKSTMLRILAGLENRTSGELIVVRRNDHTPLSAMVFQEHSIFPWMTVEQNIGFGILGQDLSQSRRNKIVREGVERTGLSGFERAYPHQLSGGMKQRVAIARAFATDAELLLMDEPFAALDEQNKLLLQEELLRICERVKKTVVFITHSIDEAVALGDRVLVMTARPGRIKQILPVHFPRPRILHELRREQGFVDLVYEIRGMLREEVSFGGAMPTLATKA